ncbi:hypothetical protein Tco_1269942 [Tanacetum coccineum]
MESLNSNIKERDLQLTQLLIKQRHSHCMTWFEQLEIHLHDLYLNNSSHAVDAFKPAFRTFFGEEHQTFRLKMFHNLDQLRLQLERNNLHKVNTKTCLEVSEHSSRNFLPQKGNLDILETVIRRAVITYGILRMKENEVNALKNNERQMQTHESKVDLRKALDADLVITESSGIESERHDTSSSLGNYITHVVDADIRPVNDQMPFVEVQLTTKHNVLDNEQQHTE